MKVLPCMARWSEVGADIEGSSQGCQGWNDGRGPRVSTATHGNGLQASEVKNDDQGNVRLAKQATNNTARDDVAAAAVLAAGHMSRQSRRRRLV